MLKLVEIKKLEEVRRKDDPKYYLYHRLINYPTEDCYMLKDTIQTLVDAKVIQLQLE